MKKWALRIVAGCVLLVAAGAGSLWFAKAFCTRTVLLEVPVVASNGKPGDLYRVEQIGTYPAFMLRLLLSWGKLPAEISVQYGVRMCRVQYWTETPQGKATVASGLVCLPKTTAPRGAVSYHHGTATNRQLSPSAPTLVESGLGAAVFAGGGYLLCAPDYVGLGVNREVHPYLHARGTAAAAIDLLKAAHVLAAVRGVKWPERLCLLGFSQGGYSTLCVHRALEALDDARFQVVASAPVAGVYDLAGITFPRFLEGSTSDRSAYLAYLAHAYCAAYGHPLDSLLAEPYAARVPALFNGDHDEWVVTRELPPSPRALFRPEFLDAYDRKQPHWFTAALAENDAFRWTPRAPVRLYYGSGDKLVSAEEPKRAAEEFKRRGCNVQLVDVGNHDHGLVVLHAVAPIRVWFDEMTAVADPKVVSRRGVENRRAGVSGAPAMQPG